ncbi:MAG: Gfo/Idh/MocA family oxidoreductase [Kiritimatiellaeota bacterium]|nr:Gfo/Idh/MocA family oxidoreductase [Kiritimatiellota bacterium]
MKKVKIGFIGCGKIATCSHAPEFLKIPGKTEISALYDVKAESAQNLKAKNKVEAETYASVKELLASGIAGVVISTPNSLHYELTMQALNSGVNVLVEKPMAATLKEADEMIALARKKKLVLQVNQSVRFVPAYVKIKQLIEQGKIGDPVHIRCLRASGSTPDQGWSPGAKWFIQKKFAGGLIMDIAVHMADMLGWYFGKARNVYSINQTKIKGNDVPDNVTALFDFENGATGVLELSWTIPVGGGLLEIYGSKGTIRHGFNQGNIEMCLAGGKYKTIKPCKYQTSQEWFADSIRGLPRCPALGGVGRHALAYTLAIAESGEKNKAVKPSIN